MFPSLFVFSSSHRIVNQSVSYSILACPFPALALVYCSSVALSRCAPAGTSVCPTSPNRDVSGVPCPPQHVLHYPEGNLFPILPMQSTQSVET